MRHLHRSLAILASGVLAASTAACAAHRAAHRAAPADARADSMLAAEQLVLEIENHNWSDVVIFILQDGRSSRLAQVTAGRSISVPLLARHVSPMGTFQLAVHPIGGSSDYRSESLSARTGNTVRLTVENSVARSSVAVW
jgi:hypothetical protein